MAEAVSRRNGKKRPEYWAWIFMKSRCFNPNAQQYKNYGGRGITVCDRWLEPGLGFQNFLADMGERPSGKHSLDRRDNDGNYEPGNCRWATCSEQNSNQRRQKKYGGVALAILCKEHRIKPRTLSARLGRGWSLEKALAKPSPSLR